MNEPVPSCSDEASDRLRSHYRNRIVLVTGAGGFIGGHLVRALMHYGADVQCTALPAESLSHGCVHRVDLRDEDAIADLVAQVRPEAVFHLAGVVDTSSAAAHVSRSLQGNLVASVNVLLAAEANGVPRVVLTGSSEELTGEAGATSPYAAAKLSVRPWVGLFRERYGLDVVTLRPFMAYGPEQPPHRLIPQVALHLLAGNAPTVKDPERICDFTYVDDVVQAFLLAGMADSVPAGDYDVGTGVGTRVADACEGLRRLLPESPAIEYLPRPASVEPHIAFQHGARIPGWAPCVALDAGLERTLKWYRSKQASHSEDEEAR